MKYVICFVLVLFWCGGSGEARAGTATVRKQAEMSMLVTGSIEIEKDGSIGKHAIDQPHELPPAVTQLIDKAMPQWRFEPVQVEGKVVRARAKMGMRVIAIQLDDGNYQLRIGSASFGDEEAAAEKHIANRRKKLTPPRYPEAAYRNNITGTVYLLVKVNAQGDVDDVATEQVNLTVVGNERQMEQGRKLLSDASAAAARKWRFNVPTREDLGDDGYMVMRVPVDYKFRGQKEVRYGQWSAYIPGPRQRPTWVQDEDARQSPDAMIAGTAYPVGSGPKLLTPLTEG